MRGGVGMSSSRISCDDSRISSSDGAAEEDVSVGDHKRIQSQGLDQRLEVARYALDKAVHAGINGVSDRL